MRRTGHIRERSPGSFELRYALGTNPATSKRRTATVTVRGTRREAERELRRLLRSVDTGEHVDPNRIKVREWLARWLDTTRAEVAARSLTISSYPHSATYNSPSLHRRIFRMLIIDGQTGAVATASPVGLRLALAGTSIAFSAPHLRVRSKTS